MIKKKNLHFNEYADFIGKKLSANVENTKYTIGVGGEVKVGEPDIMFQSIVVIKDKRLVWTHGHIEALLTEEERQSLTTLRQEFEDDELVTSKAINDLNDRLIVTEAVMPTKADLEEGKILSGQIPSDIIDAVDKCAENTSAIANHAKDTDNPHKVTKAQVGLGNVDNTSDADKPLSTATQEALDGKVDKVSGKGLSTEDFTSAYKNTLDNLSTNYAPLVDGLIPSANLPSYVDDVLEYPNKASFPAVGESGKIYLDTTENKSYRWGGTIYTEISASLSLGETSTTAFAGDKGKEAYDLRHAHANKSILDNISEKDVASWNKKVEVVDIARYMGESDLLPFGNFIYAISGSDNVCHNIRRYTGELYEGIIDAYIIFEGDFTDGTHGDYYVFKEDGTYVNHHPYYNSPENIEHVMGAAVATTAYNGLMSKEDKKQLNTLSTDMLDVYDYVDLKVDKEDGKGLSSNDYTNSEKAKVASNAQNIAALRKEFEDDELVKSKAINDLNDRTSGLESNKADRIDLVAYSYEGAVLPTLYAIFLYDGRMTHHRTIYDIDGEITGGVMDYYHIFCAAHDREYNANALGYMYLVFDSERTFVKSYDGESGDEIPDVILRAFGEAPATADAHGLMSAEDKKKLDGLKNTDVTQFYTKAETEQKLEEYAKANSVPTIVYVGIDQSFPLERAHIFVDGDNWNISTYRLVNVEGILYMVFRNIQDMKTGIAYYYMYAADEDDIMGYLGYYSGADVPAWVLEAFGEAVATSEKNGLMSSADKVLLDADGVTTGFVLTKTAGGVSWQAPTVDQTVVSGYATEQWVTSKGYLTQSTADGRYVQAVPGKGLSTNDFTNYDKTKLGNAALKADLEAYSRVQALEDVIEGREAFMLGAVHTYEGRLTHNRSLYDIGDILSTTWGYYHVFCCTHDVDYDNDTKGYLYIVFTEDGEYVRTYDKSNGDAIPQVILRAFGEANATTDYSGLMSSTDKTYLNSLPSEIANIKNGYARVVDVTQYASASSRLPTTRGLFVSGNTILQNRVVTIGNTLYYVFGKGNNGAYEYWMYDNTGTFHAHYAENASNVPAEVKNAFVTANGDEYVKKIEGKGLSSNDYTTSEKTKLASISISDYGTITVGNKSVTPLSSEALSTKVDKVSGKGLSSNDFTDTYKGYIDALLSRVQALENTVNTLKKTIEDNEVVTAESLVLLNNRVSELESI